MAKSIISEGKTTAEAIETGLKELNVSKEEVDIRVIEEKKKSFFSILDPHIVRVEIILKNESAPKEQKEKVQEISNETIETAQKEIKIFLNTFLQQISKNITFKVEKKEQGIMVEFTGEDATKLIGYRGETLNAMQLILSTIVQNKTHDYIQVFVDTCEYREKREKTLEALAKKMENVVDKTGKKITLEPMSAYERKIIHTTLQDSERVKTYSIGQGESRRVVIVRK